MGAIAERILQAMNEKSVTQAELSNRTGINRGTLNAYVKGRYEPKQKNISKIAHALGVTEGWLLGASTKTDGEDLGDYELNRSHLDSVDPDLIPYLDELSNPNSKKRILFDKVKDLDPSDVESLLRVIRMFEEGK